MARFCARNSIVGGYDPFVTVRNRKVEQGAATRGVLVDAAVELFAEKGFAETSTTEIVHRAGLTRGAMYHHFTDKEQLFEAALDAIEGRIFDRVRVAAAKYDGDAAGQVRAGVDAFLDACLEPAVQRILLQEAPSVLGWGRWQQLDRPRCARQLLAAGLASAIEAGLIAEQPAEPLTHLLYGALVQAGLFIGGAKNPKAARATMGAAAQRLLDALFR